MFIGQGTVAVVPWMTRVRFFKQGQITRECFDRCLAPTTSLLAFTVKHLAFAVGA